MSVVPALLALYDGPRYAKEYYEWAFDMRMTVAKIYLPPQVTMMLESVLRWTPFHCMLAVIVIIMGCQMVRVVATIVGSGSYDNVDSRKCTKKFIEKGTFFGKVASCAQAAHDNGLENFPVFAAGVLSCVVTKVDPALVTKICVGHVFFRTAFSVLYVLQPFFGPLAVITSLCRSIAWLSASCLQCFLLAMAAQRYAW